MFDKYKFHILLKINYKIKCSYNEKPTTFSLYFPFIFELLCFFMVGLDEEMNLIELQSENDDSDVKPMTSLSNSKRTSQRVKKMLTRAEPIEESSICNNETSEEPNNIRESK